jgi:arabinofuranosyltransferase
VAFSWTRRQATPRASASGPIGFDRLREALGNTSSRWALPLVLVVGLVAVFPFRNFAGDDAYISFRFARNLADGAGFSFNPFQPTYGSTSPLWVFLLAGLYKLGTPMLFAAHFLSYVFVGLSLLVFWHVSRLYVSGTAYAVLATLLLAFDPWFMKWGMSGMENGLALFLLLTGWWVQLRLRDSGRLNFLSPLLWALATLARPEMALLFGLGFVDNLLHERRRRTANALVAIVLFAGVYGPWLLYAYDQFGTIVPNTIQAKISGRQGAALENTVRWLGSFWLTGFVVTVVAVVLNHRPLARGLRRLEVRRRYWLPLAWAATLLSFYIVGGAPVSGRYEMYATPVFILINVVAVAALLPRLQPSNRTAALLAYTLGSLIYLGLVTYQFNWYNTRFAEGMDPRLIGLGRTLERESQPGDWIAADQIGAVGYFSQRNVLDIVGLVSPEMIVYHKQGAASGSSRPTWEAIYQRRPQFLVLVDDWDEMGKHGPEYGQCIDKVAGPCVELLERDLVLREGATSFGGESYYYVYRTHWPG